MKTLILFAIIIIIYIGVNIWIYKRGGLPYLEDIYHVDENDIVEIHGPET